MKTILLFLSAVIFTQFTWCAQRHAGVKHTPVIFKKPYTEKSCFVSGAVAGIFSGCVTGILTVNALHGLRDYCSNVPQNQKQKNMVYGVSGILSGKALLSSSALRNLTKYDWQMIREQELYGKAQARERLRKTLKKSAFVTEAVVSSSIISAFGSGTILSMATGKHVENSCTSFAKTFIPVFTTVVVVNYMMRKVQKVACWFRQGEVSIR